VWLSTKFFIILVENDSFFTILDDKDKFKKTCFSTSEIQHMIKNLKILSLHEWKIE
jgi:hypothetical protein